MYYDDPYGEKLYTSWNNKSVSKAYFDRALKRVVGKTRFTKYKFYKNTSSNRRRYLK